MSNNTIPSNPNRFRLTLLAFSFFTIIPIITVLFSKYGLDRYREMRADMKLLKDSISVGKFTLYDANQDTFNDQNTLGKARIIHFVDAQTPAQTWLALQQLQKAFHIPEDKPKLLYLSCFTANPNDSTFAPPAPTVTLDKSNWFLVQNTTPELAQRLKIAPDKLATTFVLVNPKGYICDTYDISDAEELSRLVHNLPIVIPRNTRKKVQYRPDSTLYK